MNKLATKLHALEDTLNQELLERKKEIHTSILALLARKHHFQIGPPGTAKSLLVTRLIARISGLDNDEYFHWLLTRYSTPEEIFGPPNLPDLREGIYRRNTSGKLPVAKIVFLDEIFKGNSSILNANLTAMNERKFLNGDDDCNIPLISLFAASNELPEGEELNALWDRLHFRHEITPINASSSFVKMLSCPMENDPKSIISLEEVYTCHDLVDKVTIDDSVYEALNTLRTTLKEHGVEATERRWVESLGIIRAEAFLNGREIVDIEDIRPLMHVLWSDMDQRKTVTRHVLELANPVDKEAQELLDIIKGIEKEFQKVTKDADNHKAIAKQAVEAHGRLQKVKQELDALTVTASESGRKSEILDEVKKRFVKFANQMMQEAFGQSNKFTEE